MSTAAGEPLRVITTRSWWLLTRSMNSENRDRTSRSDSLDMYTVVPRPGLPGPGLEGPPSHNPSVGGPSIIGGPFGGRSLKRDCTRG